MSHLVQDTFHTRWPPSCDCRRSSMPMHSRFSSTNFQKEIVRREFARKSHRHLGGSFTLVGSLLIVGPHANHLGDWRCCGCEWSVCSDHIARPETSHRTRAGRYLLLLTMSTHKTGAADRRVTQVPPHLEELLRGVAGSLLDEIARHCCRTSVCLRSGSLCTDDDAKQC